MVSLTGKSTLRLIVQHCNRPSSRTVYRRVFERWQERVKAAQDKERTEKSQRKYFRGTDVYLTSEKESFAPPGKDSGNLTNVEQGGMSLETFYYYARLRYLDTHPRTMRLYKEYQDLIAHQYDQRFIPERHILLGPDLAAAHFIVHRGGAVKFFGDDRWHCRNERDEYFLPGTEMPGLCIEAIDASNTALMFEGMDNLIDLEKIRFLSLNNCRFVNDFCMSKMGQFAHSLELLDLSNCKKLSANGISALSCLKKLRYLRLEGMNSVKNIGMAAICLEEANPNLQVIGLDYEMLLEDCERRMKLLSDDNVVNDAKGNTFLKDSQGELYYISGNVPEHSTLAEDEMPIFVSRIRKDPPLLPLEETKKVDSLSGGKLKHFLAGSPSGEWTQETERVLQVEARRALNEGRAVHPFLEPNRPEDTSWKTRFQRLAINAELLQKGETLSDLIGVSTKQDKTLVASTKKSIPE